MGRPKLNLSLKDKIKILLDIRKWYMAEVIPHHMSDEELFMVRHLNNHIGAFKPFKGWTCRYESDGTLLYFHPRRASRWGYANEAVKLEGKKGIKPERINSNG